MLSYYAKSLNAERLQLCYDVAPPRIQRYLNGEIQTVSKYINKGNRILELGCGYGRVLASLPSGSGKYHGIDISRHNLHYGRATVLKNTAVPLFCMDASKLAFKDRQFELVFCIQNGIAVFRVDPLSMIREALRVTRSGGKLLFSGYSEKIWDERLEWFRIQAQYGLIGAIDENKSGAGVIVCRDGFTAGTFGHDRFHKLCLKLGKAYTIFKVDDSAVFCEITV